MSEAAELEKLAALRDAGTITAKEFERKKKQILTGKKKRGGWWWRIPLAIVGIILGIAVFSSDWDRGREQAKSAQSAGKLAGLPACNASNVKETLADAIRRNASANLDTLRLFDWSNITQLSERETPAERVCRAQLHLNSGATYARYRMYYPSPESRNWLLMLSEE
ncbi:SHOCT domain-containing protein [Roseomonas gilardii]|uniref:SHOCT domain-containing protein n=1 Tax=Roseomonas gilardii TaxID=257708 RepID=UPI00138E1A71|nr:SHOCT domain-containing protein [Roseomonas gilardii]